MSTAPTESDLLVAFNDRRAISVPVPQGRVAAVAMVFRPHVDGLQLCIGRRASVAGDPWSGDLAFPGGKADPEDDTLHAVASRESFEEVGLRLEADDLIGDMGNTSGHGGRMSLAVHPLVYFLRREPEPFDLNHEFSDARWVRLADLWQAENWMRFVYPPSGMEFPGIRALDHVFWGFSLGVLHDFSRRTGRPLTALMESRRLPLEDGRRVAGEHR